MRLLLPALVLSSQLVHAAPQIPPRSIDVHSILSLPVANRVMVASENRDEVFPKLKEMAFSSQNSMELRWNALSLAAQIAPKKESAELASRALKQKEWFMKNAGLLVLQALNHDDLKKHSLSLLSDPALVVRSAAVASLKDHTNDPVVRKALWEQLFHSQNFRKGQSLWIRRQIAEVMLKDLKAFEKPMLDRLKADKDQDIQELIAKNQSSAS